jgi:hypothetical protein
MLDFKGLSSEDSHTHAVHPQGQRLLWDISLLTVVALTMAIFIRSMGAFSILLT